MNHARLSSSLGSIPVSRRVGNVNDKNAFALRAYEAELLRARVECMFEYARNIRNIVRNLRGPKEAQSAFEFTHRNEDDFGQLVEKYILAHWPEDKK